MSKERVIQPHHLIYDERKGQEVTVKLYKGEHRIATLMQIYCRKNVSKGFMKWLKFYLAINEDRAIDLEREDL